MNYNFRRRQFLQTALYSSLLYGVGGLPKLVPQANAMPVPLTNRILVNLFLAGGPDFRHLIVPAFDSTSGSFGDKYWSNRQRSHSLALSGQTAEQRWNEDFYPITIGSVDAVSGFDWNASGLVDMGGLNTGVRFGVWREAGWLIDMFRSGNVALIFNAVGGRNRAHDLSSLMLEQGDVLTSLNHQDRSGWGGRLARSAGGNPIALTRSPSAFTFGPVGSAPYSLDGIDNSDLVVVNNSRQIGLFDPERSDDELRDYNNKMARAAKSYYAALRNEQIGSGYNKFLNHELRTRAFGNAIDARILSTPIPELIDACMRDGVSINGQPVNPDPANGNARRVLRSNFSFGRQIQNLYDMIAWNDISVTVEGETLALNPRVMSMSYGGWDTHGSQRQVPGQLASDPTNPYVYRGIESGLRDIFEGQFGPNPSNPNALHAGFSALWQSLTASDRSNIVMTIAGEFGRQIRDNGDNGTDHGKGNLMLVICEACQGGIYGEMFPGSEIVKYDQPPNRTPDIDPRTEFDHFFSKVCDWVQPGSGINVFPRMASGTPPMIEQAGMFDNLLS